MGGCVSKKEAVKLLGVTMRQVSRYLASGDLSIDHVENGKVMIPIEDIYYLRAKNRNKNINTRKRG